MAKITMIEAVNQALSQEMARDMDVVLIGEDVGIGGVFRATEGLQAKFGPTRVFDSPLAESGIIGTAIGMAAYGLKPIAEIQFNSFTMMGYHQLKNHAGKLRSRSRGRFTVPLVIRTPYGGGIRPLEEHSDSLDTIYSHTPGIKAVVPSTPYDAKGLLISAIRDPDPVVFLEPTKLYRTIKEEVPDELYTVPIGKGIVRQEGKDVTLISWGGMMKQTLEAAELVKEKGISPEVIDLRSICPIDTDIIFSSVKKTGRVVIVHEDFRSCGLAAEIIAELNENMLTDLIAPPVRIVGFDCPFPLYKLEDYIMPSTDRVVSGINKAMSF